MVLSHNALCTRYTPLLYSCIISNRKISRMRYCGADERKVEQIVQSQFTKLLEVMRKRNCQEVSSWNDPLVDDNCSFEKVFLSSFNFGVESPSDIRWIFEEILTFASEALLTYVIELIGFWVESQAQWITADDWLYRQCITVITNVTSKLATEKCIAVISKLVKFPKIKAFAAQDVNLGQILSIEGQALRTLLIANCQQSFLR